MMTSRFTPLVLLTRSSSLALASGFSTALSTSKKASAAYVTFSLTGAAGGAGGGGGATGAGAGAGGGGAAGGGGGFTAPSQFSAAVAGVQLASRQHSSFVPFFHTSEPSPLRQLSTDFW